MKRFKGLLLIILVVALLLETTPCFAATHAEEDAVQDSKAVTATLSTNEIPVAGQRFYVHMILNSAGIYGASGSLGYSDNLTLVAVNCADGNWQVATNGNNFSVYGTTPTSEEVEAVSFLFQVNAKTKENDPVSVSVQNLTLSDGEQDISIAPLLWEDTAEGVEEPILPPEECPVLSIAFDKDSYGPEDIATVTAQVAEGAGVSRISLELTCDEGGYCYFELYPQSSTVFSGSAMMRRDLVAGSYSLESIYTDIEDFGGMEWSIPQALKEVGFAGVENELSGKAVSIVSISQNKSSVTVPGEVEITATTDELASAATLRFSNGANAIFVSLQPDAQGILHGVFATDTYTQPGTYVVNQYWIYTAAGSDYFDKPAFPISITVINNNAQDTVAPTITGVSLDKQRYQAMENRTVTLSVEEEASEAYFAELRFYNPVKDSSLSFGGRSGEINHTSIGSAISDSWGECTCTREGNTWTYRLHNRPEVDKYTPSGTYHLVYAQINDTCGNRRTYAVKDSPYFSTWGDLSDCDDLPQEFAEVGFIIALNAFEDHTPPVVSSIAFDKAVYSGGDTVQVALAVTDDVSGVQSVGLRFASCSYVTAVLGKDGLYHCSFTIPENMPSGTIKLEELYVCDLAWNSADYYDQSGFSEIGLGNVQFRVSNPNGDKQGPVVTGVSLDKTYAEAPDMLYLDIAYEDASEIRSASVSFINTNKGKNWTAKYYTVNEKVVTFCIDLSQYVPSGTYRFQEMTITDEFGNRTYYYAGNSNLPAGLNNLYFTVAKNPYEDSTYPWAEVLTFSENVDETTGKLTSVDLTVWADDSDSGVDYASVDFTGSSGKWIAHGMTLGEDGYYHLHFNVSDLPEGIYYLNNIHVIDRAGNLGYYYDDYIHNGNYYENYPSRNYPSFVISGETYDLIVSSDDPDIAAKISATSKNAVILVDFSRQNEAWTLSKETLGTVKGTNRTLQIKDGRNALTIRSEDITELCDVTLPRLSGVSYYTSASAYTAADGTAFSPIAAFNVWYIFDTEAGEPLPFPCEAAFAVSEMPAVSHAHIYRNCYEDGTFTDITNLATISGDMITLRVQEGCEYVVTDGPIITDKSLLSDDRGMLDTGVEWSFDAETQTLTLSGNGALYQQMVYPWGNYLGLIKNLVVEDGVSIEDRFIFSGWPIETAVVASEIIPYRTFDNCSQLKYVTLTEDVRILEPYAFNCCRLLEAVDIANGLQEIDSYAFEWCENLQSIELPDTVTCLMDEAFQGCSALESVKLSSSLSEIRSGMFRDCDKLTDVIIPDSVTTIAYSAFENCYSLRSVTLGKNLREIDHGAFYRCQLTELSIPNSVTTIAYSAFRECSALQSVAIGNGVTEIGNYAFSDCYSLKELTLGNSVRRIGVRAFFWCHEMKNVSFPDSVDTVDGYAFASCYKLESVDFSKGVSCLAETAFNDCPNLRKINIDAENPYYKSADGILYNADMTTVIKCTTDATEIALPNTVTTIGRDAFRNCTKLTTIVLPDSVTEIAYEAFKGCTSLTSVDIPSGVEKIDIGAFDDCSALATVTLHEGLYYISEDAFRNCISLQQITLPNSTTTIASMAFQGCSGLTAFHIPKNVTWCDGTTLYRCPNLAVITVDANNAQYAAIDGVLYNKDLTNVIKCPEKKTSVSLPSSVTTVGMYAFANCTHLNTIDLRNITWLRGWCFVNCTALESVKMPESIFDMYMDFYGCTSLKSISIPVVTTARIAYAEFAYCTSLQEVTIPEGVTVIEDEAFYGCTALESLHLPSTLEKVYQGDRMSSITRCSALTSITVDSKNPHFNSIDGMLFSRDLSVLYVCPEGKETESIPNSVTAIAYNAFAGCNRLNEVTIPSSVDSIGFNNYGAQIRKITFQGDMPDCGWNPFGWEAKVAYYPYGNKTYEDESRTAPLGENATWYPYGVGTIQSLTMKNEPNRFYVIGDEMDLTELRLEATYDSGFVGIVPIADVAVNGFDSDTVGKKDVTLTYEGKSVTFEVYVHETQWSDLLSAAETPIPLIPTQYSSEEAIAFGRISEGIKCIYSSNDTRTLKVTFSEETAIVDDEIVFIGGRNSNWIDAHTLAELPGRTIEVDVRGGVPCMFCILPCNWNSGEGAPKSAVSFDRIQAETIVHDYDEDGICRICGSTRPGDAGGGIKGNGDLNGNGRADAEDLTILARYLAGKKQLTVDQLFAADVDDKSGINADDLAVLARYVAHIEEEPGTPGGYTWPMKTRPIYITAKFGPRKQPTAGASTLHNGIDIGVSYVPVYAAKAGTVTLAGTNGGFGNCVIISHGTGYSTAYGHLSSIKVKVGDVVTQGQQIAVSGNTGTSTGPHLDFRIMEAGVYVDPLNYLSGYTLLC